MTIGAMILVLGVIIWRDAAYVRRQRRKEQARKRLDWAVGRGK